MSEHIAATVSLNRIECDLCEPETRLNRILSAFWLRTWRHADNCPSRPEEPCS